MNKRPALPPDDVPVYGLPVSVPVLEYTRLTCPKCRSNNLTIIEKWQCSITWVVKDGWFVRNAGALEPDAPDGLEAICGECRHSWTPRNATQVGDVVLD